MAGFQGSKEPHSDVTVRCEDRVPAAEVVFPEGILWGRCDGVQQEYLQQEGSA